jgi:hypothetical protein
MSETAERSERISSVSSREVSACDVVDHLAEVGLDGGQ